MQGLKSISISPAITTTPALDSLFPMNVEDMTGQYLRFDSDTIRGGDQFDVVLTPTDDIYLAVEVSGSTYASDTAGAPVTISGVTAEAQGDLVGFALEILATESPDDEEPTGMVNVVIVGQSK